MSDAPRTIMRLYGPDGELPLVDWSIAEAMSAEPLSWEATIDNAAGAYNPADGVLDCDAGARFNFEMQTGGVPWRSPDLVQLDYQIDEEASSSLVKIKGSDLSEKLLIEDQFLPDVHHASNPMTAHAIFAAVGTLCGVDIKCHFLDFSPPEMHLVGTPFDWLHQLLELVQGWMEARGATLHFYAGGEATYPSEFNLVDNRHLKLLSYRRSRKGIYNAATAQRVATGAGRSTPTPIRARGVGFCRHSFSPSLVAILNLTIYGGRAELITWWAEDGSPLSTTGPTGGIFVGTTVPAASVQFSLVPDAAPTPENPDRAYELSITGYTTPPPNLDQAFEATYEATSDQAKSLRRPMPEPLTSQLLSSEAQCLDYATRVVREQLLNYGQIRLSTLANPLIRPGQGLTFDLSRRGLLAHWCLVRRRIMSGTATEAVMALECARPRVLE